MGNDTSGEQITHTVIRERDWVAEDVSTSGFEMKSTVGYLPTAKIFGSTGISASVEWVKHQNNETATFYVSNPVNYNKFYYSVAGNFIGDERHTTTTGEVWETESIIEVNTNL